MKNTREHIIDKQVAEQLQGHEITPSQASWQRLARQLPFVDAAVHMPWYYNARNVAVVAIFIGFLSFAGGYYFSEFNKGTEAMNASKQLTQAPIEQNSGDVHSSPENLVLETSPIYIAGNQATDFNNLNTGSTGLPVVSKSSSDRNNDAENANSHTPYLNNNSGGGIAINLLSENNDIAADLSQMALLTASLPLNEPMKEVGNRDLEDQEIDDVIEPKKRNLPLVAFKLGLGYALTANSFNSKRADETEYLNTSLFNSAPRLTLDANIGKFLRLRSGVGFETMHSSSVLSGVQLYQEDKSEIGIVDEAVVPEGYTNYFSNTHQMVQIPLQFGVGYEVKRFSLELLGGLTCNKVISATNSTTRKLFTGGVSSGSQNLNAVLTSAINPEFTFGLGYGITNKLSVIANPYYRINQGFKVGNQSFAKTGEFGGMLRLTYSL
ncbi:MAG: hypothetical protein KDC92_10485 [Bacteroidetes bacterium]|nr:hypothetical protein [Bacteroidota bacterium]